MVCKRLVPSSSHSISYSLFVGLNKLLQRLPDLSREEVRNQSIILIQQLTVDNEEMKKTVAFNDVNILICL